MVQRNGVISAWSGDGTPRWSQALSGGTARKAHISADGGDRGRRSRLPHPRRPGGHRRPRLRLAADHGRRRGPVSRAV